MAFWQTVILPGGESAVLILLPAAWRIDRSERVEIAHRRRTEIVASLSDRESRKPLTEALRLTQSATYILDSTEADDLRDGLGNLTTELVAIPLYADRLKVADWSADKIYDPEYVVNYSDDAAGFEIAHKASLPSPTTYTHFAPLLVGRMERPELRVPTEEEGAELKITVREDSPWAYRIGLVDPGVTATWPSALVPDWSRPVVDLSADRLQSEPVGGGREQALDGTEAPMRWAQQGVFDLLDRTEIKTMLAFYQAREGPHEAFVAPVWFRPGPDRPETPHSTTVRFAGEVLTLRYDTQDSAECSVKLRQLPWEISPPAGEVPEQPPEAWFIKFTYDLPIPQIDRYTTWEKPLTITADGPYNPALIEPVSFSESTRLDDEFELVSWAFPGNPLLKLIPAALERSLSIEARRGDPTDPDNAALEFSGQVVHAEPDGKLIRAKAKFLGGMFEQPVPGYLRQRDCNYSVFDSCCGLDQELFRIDGTITTIAGTQVDVTLDDPGADNKDTHWFALGWLEVGTGASFVGASILESTKSVTAPHQILITLESLDASYVGLAVKLYPGCDNQPDTCDTKFANYLNFGGEPFVPEDNLVLKAVDQTTDVRKK